MPLTRLSAEKYLDINAGTLVRHAGLDPTPSGANPVYGAVLADAMGGLGITPGNATDAGDADLARVPESRGGQLLAMAKIQIAQLGLTRALAAPKSKQWPGSVKVDYGDPVQYFQSIVKTLWEEYRNLYQGSGSPAVADMHRQIGHQVHPFRPGWLPAGDVPPVRTGGEPGGPPWGLF